MSLRLSFYPQQKKQCLDYETKKIKNEETVSPLQMFEKLEKTFPHNEAERIRCEKATEVLRELDALIGLQAVKKLIVELQAFIEIQKRRERENLLVDQLVLHAIFRGNPGTGKQL